MKRLHNPPKFLVLGSNGMVGQFLFSYFLSKYPDSTWGTARSVKNKNVFFFDCYETRTLERILKNLNGVDFVINCIGALITQASVKEQVYLNAYFPHVLETLADKYQFFIINIGTDAVFPNTSAGVTESTEPSPDTIYGMCKFLGESQSERSITLRTSILGINKLKNDGFLNWIIENRDNKIDGYINQKWAGCTTLQLAVFCHQLVSRGGFSKLRTLSPFFHFSPIYSTTKFEIAETFIKVLSYKCVLNKAEGQSITRKLDSKYKDILASYCPSSSIKTALVDLANFEPLIS